MSDTYITGLERGRAKTPDLNAILEEAWENAPEDVKQRIRAKQNQQISVSFQPEEPKEYFNTLKENQCKNLCSSGKCHADCCGCVNILESHFKSLKKFIPEDKEYYPVKFKEDGYVYIKPMTKNYKCIFLNKDNSCSIYHSHLRPSICKRFGEDATEPLFACTYINEEMKSEIEEFSRLYLQQQAAQNNPIAKTLIKDQNSLDSNNLPQE